LINDLKKQINLQINKKTAWAVLFDHFLINQELQGSLFSSFCILYLDKNDEFNT